MDSTWRIAALRRRLERGDFNYTDFNYILNFIIIFGFLPPIK